MKLKNTILLTIESSNNNYLRDKFYKISVKLVQWKLQYLKEIKEHFFFPKWRDTIIRFMDWKIQIVKVSILPKLIHTSNAISIKITSKPFFKTEANKLILKFTWKHKLPKTAKVILKSSRK